MSNIGHIEKGVLKINLLNLVSSLDKHDHNELCKYLVADDNLWKAILECVSDDSRYFGHYFKDDEDGEWSFSSKTVLELREKLIPLMPEIARLSVREALQQRNEAVAESERYKKWAWRMYHTWPDHYRPIPELDGRKPI